MITVQKEVEVAVRLKNELADCEKVFDILAACGIEVLASNSYFTGKWMLALLITDNAYRAQRALDAAGFDCRSDSVISVDAPVRSTAAQVGLVLRGAGIRIVYSYLSMASGSEEVNRSRVILKTSDDDRAVAVLRANFLGPTMENAGQEPGWGMPATQAASR